MEEREEFLTARQLAKVLQVSESTVRRLARKRRIPSVRVTPHIIRFHLDAVREALDVPRYRIRHGEYTSRLTTRSCPLMICCSVEVNVISQVGMSRRLEQFQ